MDEKIEQKSGHVHCEEPEVGDKLLPHLQGHTSDDERVKIERHLECCGECREELRFLKAARQVRREDFAAAALAFLKCRA